MHFWRLTPRQWRLEGIDDRARMLAHFWIKSTREAYRAQAALKESGGGKKGKGDGVAMLAEMRSLMGQRPPGM